ncbi:MAG: glycosyltransferase family 2 protein, partial [Flavobacteriales bacterium]
MSALRIAIATPSFQQAAYLEECLRSIQGQEGARVEHLVADGGSTDGSRAIIERHARHLAWWCSEPDRGQAHAINKALARATGEVFNWINSDDLLLHGALAKVADAFERHPGALVLTGARLKRSVGAPDSPMPTEDPSDPDAWFTAPRVNQQSTFYRTSALREIGGLEERLRYVFDLELWWQFLFRFGASAVRVVPWELAVFRHHPASKTATSQRAFVHETASILHGLCAQAGLDTHARLMAIGHDITPGLRPMPVSAGQAPLIERMAWRFMLK